MLPFLARSLKTKADSQSSGHDVIATGKHDSSLKLPLRGKEPIFLREKVQRFHTLSQEDDNRDDWCRPQGAQYSGGPLTDQGSTVGG